MSQYRNVLAALFLGYNLSPFNFQKYSSGCYIAYSAIYSICFQEFCGKAYNTGLGYSGPYLVWIQLALLFSQYYFTTIVFLITSVQSNAVSIDVLYKEER